MSELTKEQEEFILRKAEEIKREKEKEQLVKKETKSNVTLLDIQKSVKNAETTDRLTITEMTEDKIEISGDTSKTEKVTADYTLVFVDENGEYYTKEYKDRGLKPIYDDIVTDAFISILFDIMKQDEEGNLVPKEESEITSISIRSRESLLLFVQTFFQLNEDEVPEISSLFNVGLQIINNHPEIVKRSENFMGKLLEETSKN